MVTRVSRRRKRVSKRRKQSGGKRKVSRRRRRSSRRKIKVSRRRRRSSRRKKQSGGDKTLKELKEKVNHYKAEVARVTADRDQNEAWLRSGNVRMQSEYRKNIKQAERDIAKFKEKLSDAEEAYRTAEAHERALAGARARSAAKQRICECGAQMILDDEFVYCSMCGASDKI